MAGHLFSQAYGAGQALLLFYACSFVGWCWEVALHRMRKRRWTNRGFLAGPFLPIYGFGALLILFVCLPLARYPLRCALVGGVVASLLEYGTGEAMEAVFHVRYWDYSSSRWNLRGHICLLSCVIWAGMSVLLARGIHPIMQPLLARIPDRVALFCGGALTVFALGDAVIAAHRALELRALLERGKPSETALRSAAKVCRFLLRNPGAASRRHALHLAALMCEPEKTT